MWAQADHSEINQHPLLVDEDEDEAGSDYNDIYNIKSVLFVYLQYATFSYYGTKSVQVVING